MKLPAVQSQKLVVLMQSHMAEALTSEFQSINRQVFIKAISHAIIQHLHQVFIKLDNLHIADFQMPP